MQALVAVRKMNLLFPAVSSGSRELVRHLNAAKRRNNVKIATVAGISVLPALYAAGFFFGPAGLAASSAYALVTAGGASATVLGKIGVVGVTVASVGVVSLGTKVFLEGARFEKRECPLIYFYHHHSMWLISLCFQSSKSEWRFRRRFRNFYSS